MHSDNNNRGLLYPVHSQMKKIYVPIASLNHFFLPSSSKKGSHGLRLLALPLVLNHSLYSSPRTGIRDTIHTDETLSLYLLHK